MSAGPTSPPARQDSKAPSEPATTGQHHVELADMPSQQASLPAEEDIMQLARLGEIGSIQKLFDSGTLDATFKDEQGITPLHWAAINNHYALCHFLIQAGADVNAKGGDAVATPVLWAAKRCHYYIVNLLLQHGADPLMTDDQGFNLLHSATLDGNMMQLVLLLHLDIPIDIPDAQGHTSLMWAAYKGFPACVDLFLRWGANVYARDDQGFTALHWALVKGAVGPIQKLIDYDSDRFVENNEGKTPAITAEDMNSVEQWHRALSDCGYNHDGTPRYVPLTSVTKIRRSLIWKFFFFWPFLIIICVMYIASHMVIYAALPIAAFVGYALHWVALQALKWAPLDLKYMHKTPFLAGIFAGTLFWVGVRWVFKILPWTFKSNFILNLSFAACYGLCSYFYFFAMLGDPGYVPKLSSRNRQKALIEELLQSGKFDEQNFCVHCMTRRPLRSKHCKRCGRCVAKEDHHCPWVDNCVANNNHRQFVLYVLTLEVGVILFVKLVLSYLDVLPAPKDVQCNILAGSLCRVMNKDPFTIVLTFWAAMQLIWVTMLLAVQLVQIARALTTYESMKGHRHTHGAGDAITSFVTTGSTSAQGGQVDAAGGGPDAVAPSAAQNHPHRPHRETFCEQWKKLLGLDTFIATAVQPSTSRASQQRGNPFSRGILTNCRDFWCHPAPVFGKAAPGEALLGGQSVNYTALYEPPPRMVMRRAPHGDRGGAAYAAVGTDESV